MKKYLLSSIFVFVLAFSFSGINKTQAYVACTKNSDCPVGNQWCFAGSCHRTTSSSEATIAVSGITNTTGTVSVTGNDGVDVKYTRAKDSENPGAREYVLNPNGTATLTIANLPDTQSVVMVKAGNQRGVSVTIPASTKVTQVSRGDVGTSAAIPTATQVNEMIKQVTVPATRGFFGFFAKPAYIPVEKATELVNSAYANNAGLSINQDNLKKSLDDMRNKLITRVRETFGTDQKSLNKALQAITGEHDAGSPGLISIWWWEIPCINPSTGLYYSNSISLLNSCLFLEFNGAL